MQLQGALQQQRLHAAELHASEQRREASSVQQAQARLDADAQLAFNADLLAFASRFELDAPPPRSRRSNAFASVSPVRSMRSPPRSVMRSR